MYNSSPVARLKSERMKAPSVDNNDQYDDFGIKSATQKQALGKSCLSAAVLIRSKHGVVFGVQTLCWFQP